MDLIYIFVSIMYIIVSTMVGTLDLTALRRRRLRRRRPRRNTKTCRCPTGHSFQPNLTKFLWMLGLVPESRNLIFFARRSNISGTAGKFVVKLPIICTINLFSL